jgi:cellobiose-specific phosphotransferase system component IIA
VHDRENIEAGLAAAAGEAKAYITQAREAFAADVAQKRGLVEHAIEQLKTAHYPSEEDQRALLYEIHEAKEAFATAVQDARAEFDAILT